MVSKLVYGSFVERCVILAILGVPVIAVLRIENIRKMGALGGVIVVLFTSAVSSFVVTVVWTGIRLGIKKTLQVESPQGGATRDKR